MEKSRREEQPETGCETAYVHTDGGEGLGRGKEPFTSADVKKRAGILRERLEHLDDAGSKKN
jgi:hypothetical protein